ncbi:Uma2 family endonuclease [Kitasatospora griseola]
MYAIEPEDPHLLEDFLALEAPEGYRIELVGGEIVLSPPHDGGHAIAISRVVEQVFRAGCEFDLGCHKGLVVPGGHFIPDAVFTDYGAMDGQPPWWKPSGVVMVLEVATRLPARERRIKRSSYAAAGIARYLVLDLTRPTSSGSRFGWRDGSVVSRTVCKTAKVSSLSLIISSRRAGPQ